MRAKAISMTSAILLGGVMLVIGLLNLVSPSFGMGFLQAVGSLDPGFHASGTIASVLLGTLYGFVEGAVVGYVFGAIYDAIVRPSQGPVPHSINRGI